MLTEKYYGNFFISDGGSGGNLPDVPDEPSEPEMLAPGMLIVSETEVLLEEDKEMGCAFGEVMADESIGMTLQEMAQSELANQLEVILDGIQYILPKITGENAYGGIDVETGDPSFSKYPVALLIDNKWIFGVCTSESAGTHTISVKIPSSNGTPKVLRITKVPRTVLNQLCRVSKALKRTVDPTVLVPFEPSPTGDGTLN